MNINDLKARLFYIEGQRNEVLRIIQELEKEAADAKKEVAKESSNG